jgi:MinD superfamily P-loop ATPase
MRHIIESSSHPTKSQCTVQYRCCGCQFYFYVINRKANNKPTKKIGVIRTETISNYVTMLSYKEIQGKWLL